MRCPSCQEEVLLAEICPYCGASVPQDSSGQGEDTAVTSGTFVGPIQKEQSTSGGYSAGDRPAKRPGFGSFIKYFFDPTVPIKRKLIILAAIVYIISPLDLVPDLVPLLGWVDDVAVMTFLWAFISSELAKYHNNP